MIQVNLVLFTAQVKTRLLLGQKEPEYVKAAVGVKIGEIHYPEGTFSHFVVISVCSVSGVQLARILGLEKSGNK